MNPHESRLGSASQSASSQHVHDTEEESERGGEGGGLCRVRPACLVPNESDQCVLATYRLTDELKNQELNEPELATISCSYR